MAGREVREYTNLSDPKDKKWGKGKDKIDDEDITFQRMVAKMQEVAGERGGYLHGRGALDSDDLLYLKEQMEAEEDAERLLRRTEKRAFAAFKISFHEISSSLSACIVCTHWIIKSLSSPSSVLSSLTNEHKAASLADSSPASVPLPLRVEPKQKSGIRQQDLLKKVIEIKPKRHKVSSRSDGNQSHPNLIVSASTNLESENDQVKDKVHVSSSHRIKGEPEGKTTAKSLLGLTYASSDNEED
ncbi:uncharacterized protein LOC110765651 isoform X1 [Prunus avium]|uniref:Uncharacterized protein LOC110765651 isoform X1 n=3 Tax=Prunus avium TaxID=42229 RepID=A0A6P5TB99_PRUAV|nr:uncharacterized protein LOC110765651 isoform X1 [Prunus avium]XP_021824511.1 uncharacterized protein LOC110765651 isoform X1 [Prunus avium]